MNNIESLADLFGSKAKLADICEVDPAYITRLSQKPGGPVPVRYNGKVRVGMREAALTMGVDQAVAFIRAVEACLDADVCPTCGHPLDGQVV